MSQHTHTHTHKNAMLGWRRTSHKHKQINSWSHGILLTSCFDMSLKGSKNTCIIAEI